MDDSQSEKRTVLLGVDSRGNHDRLVEELSETYLLLDVDDPHSVADEVDLWIVDAATLEEHQETIQEVKRRSEPQFLPVLLVFPRERVSSLDAAVWDIVDSVVGIPIEPATLKANIENLVQRRALAQEALDSRERFESLVRTTSSAVLFLRPDGTIEFTNDAVETVFGYESDELAGEPITRLIPPRLQAAAVDGIQNYHHPGHPALSGGTLESTALHKEGHEIPIQLSYGWFEHDGEMYLTGIITELTELKERETRLEVLNRVLRHDVRNDMNLITGHAETLDEQFEEPNSHLKTILAVADDVVKLSEKARELDELLSSGRTGTREIDIGALVTEKGRQFSEGYPAATITVELPAGDPCLVEALPLIESAIDNVIENAIEHNDSEEAVVTITVARTQRQGEDVVAVEICDNGSGLPVQDIAVIETRTESPLEHASGLGLWLVNWIVSESAGEIQFSENDPHGSCITFLLPSAQPVD